MERTWKRVVFSFEFGDEGICPECGEQDGECLCPGPHSETEEEEPFEFEEREGVMYARPPAGYDWSGERLSDGT